MYDIIPGKIEFLGDNTSVFTSSRTNIAFSELFFTLKLTTAFKWISTQIWMEHSVKTG